MTLASARLKASVRFPSLRGMYQRGGTCKGCDTYICAPFDNEGGFVLVVFMNMDLVIAEKTVDEGVCGIPNNRVKNLVRER